MNIKTRNIELLLDKYHQKYEMISNNAIRLIDKDDKSYTLIEIADDKKSVTYEGRVIGGLEELEKQL
jgi:hypothetical protein